MSTLPYICKFIACVPGVGKYQKKKNGSRFPADGVTDDCKPSVGTVNQP